MSVAVRRWLPQAALEDGAIAALLAEMVSRWTAKWAAAQALPVAVRQAQPDTALGPHAAGALEAFGRDGALIFVLGEEPEWRRLLFGFEGSDRRLTRADRAFLRDARAAALTDLFETLFDARPRRRRRAREAAQTLLQDLRVYSIEIAALKETLIIAVDAAAAANLRWRALPSMPRAGGPLARRDAALEAGALQVSVDLGRCDLALGDVRSIANGDVIVLDKKITDRVALRLGGAPSPLTAIIERPAADASFTLRDIRETA